jgi:methyl-accepting chemotaxis protein
VAIRIPIIADVVDAIRGAKKLGESFDDVADALDDVDHSSGDATTGAKQLDRAYGDVADTLGDVDRQAKDAADGVADVGDKADATKRDADDMQKSFRDAFDSVRKEATTAGDSIGDHVKKGTEEADAGLKDLKEEAGQTARESAASFSDVTSALDAVQEVAANAFSGFGPAGAAAGIAAAVGLGLVFSSLQKNDEAALALTQRIIDLSQELSEVGGDLSKIDFKDKIREWSNEIKDNKSWWEVWQKDTTTNLDDVKDKADKFGISFTDLLRGMSGSDSDAAARSLGQINDLITEQNKIIAAAEDPTKAHTDATYGAAAAATMQADKLEDLRRELQKNSGVTDEAVARQKLLDEALGESAAASEHARQVAESYADALESTADPVSVYEGLLASKNDAERKAAEATAAATEDSSDSWQDYAKDVTVTTDDLITEWNRQAEQNKAFADNLAKIGAAGGQALADELRAKGPEVAYATAAAIAQSDPTVQKAAIDAHAAATGSAVGTSIAGGISGQAAAVQSAVNGVIAGIKVGNVTVPLKIDFAQAVRDYDNYVRNLPPVRVLAHSSMPQAI